MPPNGSKPAGATPTAFTQANDMKYVKNSNGKIVIGANGKPILKTNLPNFKLGGYRRKSRARKSRKSRKTRRSRK
jgi:hypothetical protein